MKNAIFPLSLYLPKSRHRTANGKKEKKNVNGVTNIFCSDLLFFIVFQSYC